MKTLNQNIFKNKSWGTETVLKDTLNNLNHNTIFMLNELNDIDTFEDLKDHPQLKKTYNIHD